MGRERARNTARRRGWPLRGMAGGRSFELMDVVEGRPLYFATDNVNAAISTAANLVRNSTPYSVNGSSVIVGVWDQGSVRSTHQEFGGRVNNVNGVAAHFHGTHVGGTIGAAGVNASALGMAPGCQIDSYDWNSDDAEMAARGATEKGKTNDVIISNHSYGLITGWINGSFSGNSGPHWFGIPPEREDRGFGIYDGNAAGWDAIAYAAPYLLIFKSAGNDRNDSAPGNGSTYYFFSNGVWNAGTYSSATGPFSDGYDNGGYDTISYRGNGKNVMTVAAVNDAVSGGVRAPGSGTMSSFSGWGPADDGRIKPDISANGISLFSTDSDSDTDYTTLSGTSMSTPNAAGSAALLADLYCEVFSNEVIRSSTLKALMIHTADDVGPAGPDYQFGWGLMNTKAAADIILRQTNEPSAFPINEFRLHSVNSNDAYYVESGGSNVLCATLVWTDPAGTPLSGLDNRTPVLVNDLDLRIIAPDGSTNYPFGLDVENPSNLATNGDNSIDNVEQVLVSSPTSGVYCVEISHKDSLSGGEQIYSLVISGQKAGSLNVTPLDGLQSTGNIGGPFAPTSTTYTLMNLSTGPLAWAAANCSDFTEVAPSNGTIAAGASTSVVVSLTSNAGSLASGTHYDQIAFTDNASGVTHEREVELTVIPPPPPDHFTWSTIGPVQLTGTAFSVTITARDALDAVHTPFNNETAAIEAYVASTSSTIVITELVTATPDAIEFMNVSTGAVDISNWQVSVYEDGGTWPVPVNFAVPPGTVVAAGGVFTLKEFTVDSGNFPTFNLGANIFWTSSLRAAVLLRDDSGNIIDFVCAANANPADIVSPVAIPGSEWTSAAVAGQVSSVTTYSRIGFKDNNDNTDWVEAVNTLTTANSGLFSAFAEAVSVSPTVTGPFASGVWSGAVAVLEPGMQVFLRAEYNTNVTGVSGTFDVYSEPTADLALAKSVDDLTPDEGQLITYSISLTNAGPFGVTGLTVTDAVPAEVTVSNATFSQGLFTNGLWTIGTLLADSNATLTIHATVNSNTAGAHVTNTVSINTVNEDDANSSNDTASAQSIVSHVDVHVSKFVSTATPTEGDVVIYTVAITNSGTDPASGVIITDAVPATVTLSNAAPSQGTFSNGAWSAGSLGASSNATLDLTVTVNGGTGGSTITNTASLSAINETDLRSGNNTGTVTLVVQIADLELTKQLDDATPGFGQSIEYLVTVTNAGPHPATGIRVSDVLSGLSNVVAAASTGSYSAATGVWSNLSLAAGGSATLTVSGEVASVTTITNTAEVSASDQKDPDSTPGNGIGAEDDQDSVIATPQYTDIAVTKSLDISTPDVGDVIVFTVTASNAGPAAASAIAIQDPLPAGLTFSNASPSQGSYSNGAWAAGSLAVDSNATLTISAVVDPGSGGLSITNVASLTNASPPDAFASNDAAIAVAGVTSVELGLQKSVDDNQPDEGQLITYTLTLTNQGPDTATGIDVTDVLPGGVTFSSATPSQGGYSNDVWDAGSLAAGQGATLALLVAVDPGTTGTVITNNAAVSAVDQEDAESSNNTALAVIAVTFVDLALSKAVDHPTPNEGDLVTYTIGLSNAGTHVASGIVVTDAVPTGVTFSNATPSSGSFTNSLWSIGTLEPGSNATLTIDVTVDQGTSDTTITNVAFLVAVSPADISPGNDTGLVSIAVNEADVSLTKHVDDSSPGVGEPVVYTIVVSNAGPNSATAVQVRDVVTGLTNAAAVVSTGGYDIVSGIWSNFGVAAGGSASLVVSGEVATLSMITNTAEVIAVEEADPDSTPGNGAGAEDDQDQVVVTPRYVDVSLSKSAGDSTPDVGDLVTFTIIASNAGPSEATSVVIEDALPAGVTFSNVVATQGAYSNGSWNAGSIAAGSNATLSIDVTIDPGAGGSSITNVATATNIAPHDIVSANDADVATVEVTLVDLGIDKAVDDATPDEGDVVVYTISLTNAGPDEATTVEVTDVLPPGVTFSNAAATQGSYSNDIWQVGSVPAGSNASLNLTVSIDNGTGSSTITNDASITGRDQEDANSSNDTAAATILVGRADLVVGKSADVSMANPGDPVVFSVTVSNSGPHNASGIQIADVLPAALITNGSSSTLGTYTGGVWSIAGLASNTAATLTINTIVDAGTAGSWITNTAVRTASAPTDVVPSNDVASVTVRVPLVDIGISKAVDVATPDVGDTVSFTIVATNAGPDTASVVRVSDTISAGLLTNGVSVSAGVFTNGVWDIGTLDPASNAILVVSAVVQAGSGGQSITNTATVLTVGETDAGILADSDSAVIDVTLVDLVLDKTVSAASTNQGSVVQFTIALSNAGPDTATGVVVSDPVSAGFSFSNVVASQGSYSNGSWSAGALAAGSNATLQISALISNGTTDSTLTNSAAVTAVAQEDGNASNNTDLATVYVVPEADLRIAKSGPADAVAGESIAYTITVTNAGPDTATNLVVTDVLPPGVTPAGPVVTNLGSLAAGATTSLVVNVDVPGSARAVLTNSATVTSSTFDPALSNNSTAIVSTVSVVTDLELQKLGATNAVAGLPVVYTLIITNHGPSDMDSAVVVDLVPEGLSPAGPITNAIGPLAALAATSVTVNVTVETDVLGSLTNIAFVDGGSADTNTVNDTNALVTSVAAESDLGLTKTAATNVVAGTSLTYTLAVTNRGPSDAGNVQLVDALPAGVSPGGSITNALGTLPAGGATSVVLQVTVASSALGALTNTATISTSATDTNTADNAASVATIVETSADLSLEKTAPADGTAGAALSYSLSVTNRGPSDATGVTVVDALPPGVSPAGAQTNALGTIAAGSSTSFVIQVAVDSATLGGITNVATVSSPVPDTNSANNTSTAITEVSGLADLAVIKTAPTNVLAGASLGYTLLITNAGPSDAAAVEVVDLLPAGVSPGGVQTNVLGALAAGSATSFVIQVTVDPGEDGILTNLAFVTTTTADTNSVNNTNAAISAVIPVADLEISKSAPTNSVAGKTLGYTISVTNRGPSDAAGVLVVDALPPGLSISGPVTNQLGAIAAGSSTGFSLVVGIDAGTLGALTNTATVFAQTADSNALNNAASAVSIVGAEADLLITKSGPENVNAGGETTYVIAVSNRGPSHVTDAVVVETAPKQAVLAGPITNLLGALPANAATSIMVSVTVDADASGVVTNRADVFSSALDTNLLDNTDTAASVVYLPIVASAGMNGSIAPSGTVWVASGGATNFTIAADAFYHIVTIRINDITLGELTGLPLAEITWSNILSSGAIDADFSENLATNSTPEWWLNQFLGVTNDFDLFALQDEDGDGALTWEEFDANTDPTNKLSVLVITTIAESDAGLPVLTWKSASNRTYGIEYTTNLPAGFTSLTNGLPTTPPLNTHTSPVTAPRIMFRVIVE